MAGWAWGEPGQLPQWVQLWAQGNPWASEVESAWAAARGWVSARAPVSVRVEESDGAMGEGWGLGGLVAEAGA